MTSPFRIIFMLFWGYVLFAPHAPCVASPKNYQVLIPQKVTDFTFSLDNADVKDYPAGKLNFKKFFDGQSLVILHLWSTSCHACKHELTDLNSFVSKMISRPVKIIALSLDDPRPATLRNYFIESRLMNLNPYHRPSPGYPKIRGLPTTFFYNRHAELVGKVEGALNWSDPAIERLLKRLTSMPAQHKSLSFFDKVRAWFDKVRVWFKTTLQ